MIPDDEILLRASRSSGPGGQHANVTASRIEAVFEIDESGVLSDEQKRRLRARFGPRVTAIAQDGIYLRVTLKALGHAVHLAFDLGAGIVVLPAAKLPALAL